jgi:hypothetical protein
MTDARPFAFQRPGPPGIGEIVSTPCGQGIVIQIIKFEKIVAEMEYGRAAPLLIEKFQARISYFLGDPNLYYECDVKIGDDIIRVDWSDWKSEDPFQ